MSRDFHPVDYYVGNMVKKRRIELGVTQKELADFAGVSFQQIQKYENGRNRITAGKLYDFAVYLATEVDYFFSGITVDSEKINAFGDSSKIDYQYEIQEIIPKTEIDDLLRYYSSVKDPATRKHIIVLARSMSAKSEAK